MADRLGVENISFSQADILKLGQLEQRFDVILCGGVLHHMADPLEGWAILRDLLKPDGVMQIDLYSQIARLAVIQQREVIAQLKMEPTADNIRRYRQALMTREPDGPILKFYDFFTMSMCRDLLFHCQEHQFTWPQIQESCDQLDLEFIGLNAQQAIFNIYTGTYPDDKECKDLNNWHQLELQYPNMFRGMYSFWCKPKGTVARIKK
jgi:SAM-dependent methyltransferase